MSSASLAFKVGRPWGKTSLITDMVWRDVLFRPLIREYYTTDAYLGLQRRFGTRLQFAVLADYIRAWKCKATIMRPRRRSVRRPRFEYTSPHGGVLQVHSPCLEGRAFTPMTIRRSGFLVSYVKPLRGALRDGDQQVPVAYHCASPRLPATDVYNFSGHASGTFLPVVRRVSSERKAVCVARETGLKK